MPAVDGGRGVGGIGSGPCRGCALRSGGWRFRFDFTIFGVEVCVTVELEHVVGNELAAGPTTRIGLRWYHVANVVLVVRPETTGCKTTRCERGAAERLQFCVVNMKEHMSHESPMIHPVSDMIA